MALAGRYLSAAQKLGDSALLLPLRGRQVHKPTGQINYNNIQNLATEARRQLKVSMETGNIKKQPITPNLLYRKADEIISGIEDSHAAYAKNYPADKTFQKLLNKDFDIADPGYSPNYEFEERYGNKYKNRIEAEIAEGPNLEGHDSLMPGTNLPMSYIDVMDDINEALQ
jgi:hypothetical protein